mmetsp:Transcript_30378/g.88386  ORF Transcript_30378/g.88386 Transcript_30378/m.88386 type:complete len:154 (-) Transcript_30378:171-632(-)
MRFHSANAMAHVKTGATRGGFIKRIHYRDLLAGPETTVNNGIWLSSSYGGVNKACPSGWTPPELTVIQDLSFKRIHAEHSRVGTWSVDVEGPDWTSKASGLAFDDIRIAEGDNGTWSCRFVEGNAKAESVLPWPPCAALRGIGDQDQPGDISA